MSRKSIEWLYSELSGLVAKGVLPPEAADRIRQHYGEIDSAAGRRLAVIIFGVLGGLLIGAGLILLLAHNWDELSRPLRTVLSLVPLMAGQGLAGWVLVRQKESTAWREGVGAYWALSCGVAVALVGQTYHLGSDFASFMLAWTLPALPIVYLLRSSVVAALYWVGVLTWAGAASWSPDSAMELWFWPFAAAAAPHLWWEARGDRYRTRVTLLLWVLGICGCVAIGFGLRGHLDHLWMWVYSSAFAALFLAGRQWFQAPSSPFRRPLECLGWPSLMVMSLLLSFAKFSDDFARYRPLDFADSGVLRVVAAMAWPLAALVLWLLAIRRRDLWGITAGIVPILVGLGHLVGGYSWSSALSQLAFNVYVLAMGIMTVVTGIKGRQLGPVNVGLLLIAALVVARFFDMDLGFVVRGLAFVLVGIGFLVTNLLIVRRAKEAR
jgi:uncharacterized membrane protein